MPVKHPRAIRLAAAYLARQSGPEVASTALGVSLNTVKRWQREVELPATEWAAIEAVLLARVADQTARGNTRGLTQLIVAAGVASRNTNYARLVARQGLREAEPAEPEPSAVKQAAAALRPDQRLLVRDILLLEITKRRATDTGFESRTDPSEAEYERTLVGWFGEVSQLTEEQVAAELASVAGRIAAIVRVRLVEPGDPAELRADLAEPVAPPPEQAPSSQPP